MEPRTETLTLRLSPAEMARLEDAAARHDVSPGTLVRRSLAAHLARLLGEEGRTLCEDPRYGDELVARCFE